MFRMTKKSYNLINIIEEMDKNIKEYQEEDSMVCFKWEI